MEPAQKKAKITGHFRVALKPQDINVQRTHKKFKKHLDIGKENIDVITISSDDEDDDDYQLNQVNKRQIFSQQPEVKPFHISSLSSSNTNAAATTTTSTITHDNNNTSYNKLKQNNKSYLQLPPVDIKDEPLSEWYEEEDEEEEESEYITNDDDEKENNHKDSKLHQQTINKYFTPLGIPSYVKDHDKFMLDDMYSEPHYAWDSFKYDRERELLFRNENYLETNLITPEVRAKLVNWLCKLQDMFSIYHESLYRAVKIADQYLMKKSVPKGELQLLFLTSMFISVKYDERQPPVEIEQFLRQVGRHRTGRWVYNRSQVINTEVDILCTLQFDIRFPLSYNFLRRFARCTLSGDPGITVTLFLARYILEASLLDYRMIEILESKLAAAAFLLALRMRDRCDAWNETAEFYIGYKQEDLRDLIILLNKNISEPTHTLPNGVQSHVKRKYSDVAFHSVAKIPTLTIT